MALALWRPKEGDYINISDAKLVKWRATYKGVNIEEEVAKANDWLKRNPSKAWKTLIGFERWLSNCQSTKPKEDEGPSLWERKMRMNAERYPDIPTRGTEEERGAAHDKAMADIKELLK